MSTTYLIPTVAASQQFSITLAGVDYIIRLDWNEHASLWILNLYSDSSVPILVGVPVVANADILAPYAYLGIGGAIVAQTEGDINTPPTFANLGGAGRIYFVTP